MRPAGISGPARQVAPVRGNDVKGRSAVRPLLVEAVEFSPALVPEKNLISGRKTMSSGAGGVAPAVVADPPVPTVAGVTFSAVAEVHVSASASEDDSLVGQASEQHIVCNTDPGKVPETSSVPAGGHARHQADEAFGSEDRPRRYTYGGDSGPGAVSVFGSGRISGQ